MSAELQRTGSDHSDLVPVNELRADQLAQKPDLLASAFLEVRQRTLALVEGLSPEDMMIQSMADASPGKWHLAHTTWFFETFILQPHLKAFQWFDSSFQELFNSYYNGIGAQYPRPRRGLIARPSLSQVQRYRRHVDEAVMQLLKGANPGISAELASLIRLGINHEEQHQELLLTDLKNAFFCNPLLPALMNAGAGALMPLPQRWCPVARGEYTIGHQGGSFCFDNETPAHRVLLSAFSISSNAVTNAEWLRFMEDGGYEDPLLWLSDGWAWRSAQQVTSPLYWRQTPSEGWRVFTLQGEKPILPGAPVSHISYYEADAFARWAGARLPTEAEWEVAASCHDCLSRPKAGPEAPNEFSQVWEWTQSAYLPYPGFEVAPGAVGEYNGKFMVNQMVLRGQSAATAPGHSRQSYRNFFPPDARWQYSGLRLARQDAQE